MPPTAEDLAPRSGPVSAAEGPTPAAPAAGPRREFLPLPPKLAGRTRRLHQVVLGVLLGLGLLQGAYWSITTVAWSPADEVGHMAYVESMARGNGIPTIGVDPVSNDILAATKEVPTLSYRSDPVAPNHDDPRWASGRIPYEAVHGPVYYVAMAPFFWLGQPLGIDGSLYAVRLGTVLFTITAIPLTWLLARRLFPTHPVTWLVAAALIAAVNSLSAGAVSNDSASMVVGTVAVLAFLRALHRPEHLVGVALAGGAFSLAVLTKTTAAVLVPFLAIAFVAAVVVIRPGVVAALRWIGLFAVGGAVVLAPWLLWNLLTYDSFSASDAIVRAVGSPLLGTPTFDRATIEHHVAISRMGIWVGPLIYSPPYTGFWEWTALLTFVLGSLAAAVRRRWRDLGVLAWCASAIPLGFVAMEAIFLGPFTGNGGPVGRHLWVAVPEVMVMIAAAVVLVVGVRVAPVVGAWMVATALWLQVPAADWFVDTSYLTATLDGDLGRVTVQDHADQFVFDQSTVVIDAGCPVHAITIGLAGAPPATVQVTAGATELTATGGETVALLPTYRLPQPLDGPITVALPAGAIMRGTSSERNGRVRFGSGTLDPVAAAYCEVDDPEAVSFEQLYRTGHPDQVSLGTVRVAPRVIAGLGVAAAAFVTVAALVGALRRRGSAAAPARPTDAASARPQRS